MRGFCLTITIGNFLIFHFDWARFLPTAFLGSMLVAATLKIGPYKTPISRPKDSKRNIVHENTRSIQDEADVREGKTCHNDKPVISDWEVEKRRMETS